MMVKMRMVFENEPIVVNPIGIIHSPFQQRGDAPRQGRWSDFESELEIFPPFREGLKDIDRASHLIVLYWGNRADRTVLQSRTPFSEIPMGVFATRSPNRPNPIAFCVAEVIQQQGDRLTVRGLDALDGSPLLDIKVYAPAVDCVPEAVHDHVEPKDRFSQDEG